MIDIDILESLADFLKSNVASKIKLKKPTDTDEGPYELVNPAVYICWVPPKNFLEEYGHDIPSLIVMMDEGLDSEEDATLSVRVKVVTYDPGEVKEDNKLTPNTQGYKDLLNVLTKIRLEISQNKTIKDKVIVEKPIRWSMDKEQIYPYWSAEISFNVVLEKLQFNYDKYL